jgi:hypothetical protein
MSGSNSSARDDAAPPEPLSLTVHTMPSPQVDDTARRTAAGRLKMMLILSVCAAPVLASYFTYFVVRPQARSNYAELILPSHSIPADLSLHTRDGKPVPAGSLKGQWLLVVVGGGQCDTGCERRLYLQRQLVEMAGAEKGRIDKVWFVDDDQPLRASVTAAVDAGVPVQVLRVPHRQLAQWLQPAPGESLDQHIYVADPMGEWMMRAPVDPDPARFKRDIDRLLRASAAWDREGR